MDSPIDVLHRIRRLADYHADQFDPDAFRTLFRTLADQLSDDYFEVVEDHLRRLKFRRGVQVSAGFGKGLKGSDYVLRRPAPGSDSWLNRLLPGRTPHYTIYLAPRDEAGANAMSELRDRGLAIAADALARSARHILDFFEMFLAKLAFYIGCLNLHERLREIGAPFAFPDVEAGEQVALGFRELYDVNLALSGGRRPIGNDLDADAKPLIVITGANQGGKTTFLRSFGVAEVMAQTRMLVAAQRFRTCLDGGGFSHFKPEEDAAMKSGKFDEELRRMSDIVDHLAPRSLILFNESFSATNEREGAEIARQIVSALLERGHRIAFVSHQFAFSHAMCERDPAASAFLRADRQEDGTRTFKPVEGEPLGASFGDDIRRELFEPPARL
jgi:DNA mismatch repair ATPase MutS